MTTHDELLDLFFENALSKEQEERFHWLLKNDIVFKEAFEFQRTLKTAVTLNERQKLKESLRQLEDDQKAKKEKVVAFSWKSYIAAASIVLVFFTAYQFWPKANNPDELFVENYEIFPNLVAPQVRGNNDEELKQKAFEAYEMTKFEQAVQDFSNLIALGQIEYAYFYRGQAYMAMGQFEEAQSDFMQHIAMNEKNLIVEAHWYMGLCELKRNHEEAAIDHFKIVSQSNENAFQSQAARLLDALRRK